MAKGNIAKEDVIREEDVKDMPKSKWKYIGMPAVEAKLRMLADEALRAADAFRDDPVRLACKKAGVKQAVTSRFFYQTLEDLDEALLKVDNIVHGWEVEAVKDLADPRQYPGLAGRYQRFLKYDVKPKARKR